MVQYSQSEVANQRLVAEGDMSTKDRSLVRVDGS